MEAGGRMMGKQPHKPMMDKSGHMMSMEARRSARKAYRTVVKKSPPGQGARFKALAKSAAAGGATSGAAVAAKIGRAKYGAKRFAAMAAAGRKRKV